MRPLQSLDALPGHATQLMEVTDDERDKEIPRKGRPKQRSGGGSGGGGRAAFGRHCEVKRVVWDAREPKKHIIR